MEITREAKRVTNTSYHMEYEKVNERGSGYLFPCNKDGIISRESMAPEGLKNLAACEAGTNGTYKKGLYIRRNSYTECAVGKCDCGKNVELWHSENECACGRVYNLSGQELQILSPEERAEEDANEFAYSMEEI
jgi:hypothetical protein